MGGWVAVTTCFRPYFNFYTSIKHGIARRPCIFGINRRGWNGDSGMKGIFSLWTGFLTHGFGYGQKEGTLLISQLRECLSKLKDEFCRETSNPTNKWK